MSDSWRETLPGVWRIDVFHPAPEHTCCYLLVKNGEGALLDCGAKKGVSSVLSAVAAAGLAREDIRWIIPTHAHLDHAGAAGALMRHFSAATLGAHPSTVKHLVNPHERLLPAAEKLYGEKFFNEQYAGAEAVPKSRAKSFADGENADLGGEALRIIYSPGHAWHHAAVYAESRGVLFAGDSYGVSFPGIGADGEIFIVPVMPPTQFNPEAARRTLENLRELDAPHAALAHFGIAANSPALADRQIAALEEWTEKARKVAETGGQFYPQFREYLRGWYADAAAGIDIDSAALLRGHAQDIHLTACGFAHWLEKENAAPAA
ncbi:MAG: MBL fold metallo-hydrolase [Gammaproteobacteria bacterium]